MHAVTRIELDIKKLDEHTALTRETPGVIALPYTILGERSYVRTCAPTSHDVGGILNEFRDSTSDELKVAVIWPGEFVHHAVRDIERPFIMTGDRC